jgi:hypothetical protein
MPYRFSSSWGAAARADRPEFQCDLKCEQCPAMTRKGVRCANRTCFGVPLCWRHTRRDLRLRIDQSTIPHAGRGVFAHAGDNVGGGYVFFPGDVIIERYVGEVINRATVDNRYGAGGLAAYGLQLDSSSSEYSDDDDDDDDNDDAYSLYVDAACRRGLASMVNAPRSGKSRDANAQFVTDAADPTKISLVATKRIRHNAEITVHYGNDYDWKALNKHSTRYRRA